MCMNEVEPQYQAPSDDTPQRQVIRTEQQTLFAGPLPPPSILEHYNRIVPGAAERILVMAEQQSQHRRSLESHVIESSAVNSRLGLIFGFVLGLLGIIIPFIFQIPGGPVVSVLALASLAGVFVYGSQQRRAERAERRKEGASVKE